MMRLRWILLIWINRCGKEDAVKSIFLLFTFVLEFDTIQRDSAKKEAVCTNGKEGA